MEGRKRKEEVLVKAHYSTTRHTEKAHKTEDRG